MTETEVYNGYLVGVAPPRPNTEADCRGGPEGDEDGEEAGETSPCNHSDPLANGAPWRPVKKTLVVSLRKQGRVLKPVMCAAFLVVLAVVAAILLFSTLDLFPRSNRKSENSSTPSPVTFPRPMLPQNHNVTSPSGVGQCGVRPAFSSRRYRRIVNGDISAEGQWPWQVAVRYRGHYKCGGVVVASRWVVTAAHCVYKKPTFERLNASYFTVLAGSRLNNQTAATTDPRVQLLTVDSFYVHPRYLAERPIDNYDVALLRLSGSLDVTAGGVGGGLVRPACLPGHGGANFGPSDDCYLASWGSVKPRLFLRPELTHIAMPLLTPDQCRSFAATISPRHLLQVNRQKFCAGILPSVSSKRAGACEFDSGSGLVCLKEDTVGGGPGSWYLVGLVSGGNKCGEVNFYTNVTSMMDFIQPLVDENLPSQFYKCDKGRTSIWSNQVCDGQFDCDDRTDEQKCECADSQFRCDNGLCKMALYYRCNGEDDCGDGSDERDCNYFDCEDGINSKLSPAMVCDKVVDCYTLKDETNCDCGATQFRCANNVCVPDFWRCDGFDDCMDASDELNCECTDDQMDCGNTRCVPRGLMCDSHDDCGNFKDEANCTCIPDHFPCESLGICLPTGTLFSDTCNYYEPAGETSDSQP